MTTLTHNAEDLVLYIDNTAELYFSIKQPLEHFLMGEMKRGSYVRSIAEKGYSLLVEQGIIAYRRELKTYKSVSKVEREAIINSYVEEFETEFMVANFDTHFAV